MRLALSPHGEVYLDETSGKDDGPGPAVASRIGSAFERGIAHGILHLGTAEVSTPLPPTLAYFRDFGRLLIERLCGAADLESVRDRIELPPPGGDLEALVESAPPMTGAEYLATEVLARLWTHVLEAFRGEIRDWQGSVESYLRERDPVWNLVGRVCFHLAENKGNEERPFAFLATYTTRLSQRARPQHVPLGQAVRDSSAARNKRALLSLLVPVERAAQKSALVRKLMDGGDLFHPLLWTPPEAHRFLREVPALEAAGVIVRVPDWWKARRRLQVGVSIGSKPPAGLGAEALLDFQVALSLDGERISEREWRLIAAGADSLVRLRGQWVEIDREKLAEILAHWQRLEGSAEQGVSFLEGMRLLAGAGVGGEPAAEPEEASREWLRLEAGEWLAQTIEGLRSPESLARLDLGEDLTGSLRPYQQTGLGWLWLLSSLGLGACLADDMGLGKTIQVLALLVARKKRGDGGKHLLVVPASLLANWQSEIERFTPSLRVLVAHPSALPSGELSDAASRLGEVDLVLTTYGYLHRLPWVAAARWDLLILDEAQAIKNPGAKQTRAVKEIRANGRVAMTGTPVENRLGDLWSLFDFLNPGLLGSAKGFARLSRRLEERAEYAPLRRLIRPYILRRLKTDRRVIADLPEKSEVKAFCALTRVQAALYQQSVDWLRGALGTLDGMQRRGIILAFLMRLKQICNHPSQWLGDDDYSADASGKFVRLAEICESIAARQEKVLIFTQFREMTDPLASALERVFGRSGFVLHGQTPVRARSALVARFQDDERVPFFVLSVKAGGTGLNLTAASHVIHFDRWWNPAVENQATDRAYRIGQNKNVLVHKLVCRGTVEEKIDALIESKQQLSAELIESGGEALLTEMSNQELMALVTLDVHRALAED